MTEPIPLPGVEWGDPAPLPEAADPLPFPTEALPGWLQHFVRAQATASQVPEDLVGMLALSALSAALQGRANTLANNNTWTEPVCLYTATVLPPAERKSSVFEHATRPLVEWEREIQIMEQPLVSASAAEAKEIESAIERADRAVSKAHDAYLQAQHDPGTAPDTLRAAMGDLDTARETAAEARNRLAEFRQRFPTKLIHNDLTPEAAVTAIVHQRTHHIAVMSDEGGVFEVLTGARYSDRLNLDPFLKAHSGNLIKVDRIGRPEERVERPMMSLGLAVQPAVLAEIGKSRQMHGRGLLARFLYSVPKTLRGTRDIDPQAVPEPIRTSYGNNLRLIAADAHGRAEPATVVLSDHANGIFLGYQQDLEPRLTPDVGSLDPIAEWAGKLAGAILRIATLLAAARECAVPTTIDEDDMTGAIEFSDYLIDHAMRAFGIMGIVEADHMAARIINAIRLRGAETVTPREIQHWIYAARSHSSEEIEEILERLARDNWLRLQVTSIKPMRKHWAVNPAVHAEETPA